MNLSEQVQIRIKIQLNQIEVDQFLDYLKRAYVSFADDGTDLFIKREIGKLIIKIAPKLLQKKLTINFDWYQYQALKYCFNNFSIPDETILVRNIFGRLDQAAPNGFGLSLG